MDRNTFNRNYKTANFADTAAYGMSFGDTTGIRGTSGTLYPLAKPVWQGELSDAARMTMYFMDSVDVKQLPEKAYQLVVPYRKIYPLSSDVSFDSTEFYQGSSVTNYGTQNIDGKIIVPAPYSKAAALGNFADYHSARSLLQDKMDELSYALTDQIDQAIATDLKNATKATVGVRGAITTYGGTAASCGSIAQGQVLTPSLINQAEVLLSSKYSYYWSSYSSGSGTFTKDATITKNPWKNEPTDPFVLIIGPRQKQALRDSGQFVNAAQYGDRVVISSGEIGEYLGIRVICSNNIPTMVGGTSATDFNAVATVTPNVDLSCCFLMKGRAAYTFVWGRTPKFETWVQGWNDLRGITLTCDYAGSVVHADAIIKIVVADY